VTFCTVKADIAGAYTNDSLQREFQKVCDEQFALLIEQNIRDNKPDINKIFKKIKNKNCKIRIIKAQ